MIASPTIPGPENRTTVRTPAPGRLALTAVRTGMRALAHLSPEGAAALAERMFLTPRRHARPAAERELLAKGRPLFLPTKYGGLAAWEWGPEQPIRFASSPTFDVPSVLLVHGWEGRGRSWRSVTASSPSTLLVTATAQGLGPRSSMLPTRSRARPSRRGRSTRSSPIRWEARRRSGPVDRVHLRSAWS